MASFTISYTNQPTAANRPTTVGSQRTDHPIQQQIILANRYNQLMSNLRDMDRAQKRQMWTPTTRNNSATASASPLMGSDLPFRTRALKMALAEALIYHHKNGSSALAEVMTVPAEAISARRGPNGEVTLHPTKGQLAQGIKPTTMSSEECFSMSCGVPMYCHRLVMLDLELVIEERGAKVAAQTLKALPLWRL